MIIKTPTSNTALLVFSLSSKEEAYRKPLFGKKNHNNKVFFDFLIKQTSQLASKTGIDVIWMDERSQKGDDFASRITNSFSGLYAQGYDNVISIGNDCPDLDLEHIQKAIVNLEKGNLVLGPSSDGGAYLIGMHSSQFNREEFKKLPWQKDTLLAQLSSRANAKNHSIYLLDQLEDIDLSEDLFTYLKNSPFSSTSHLITLLLSGNAVGFDKTDIFLPLHKAYILRALRAPPLQVAA